MRGVELRLGFKTRPDQAISIEAMKLLMEKTEAEARGRGSTVENKDLIRKGAYFMSCFGVMIRGVKGLLWMYKA